MPITKKVAVAGITGALGRFFVDEFLKCSSKLSVTVLTRKEGEESTRSRLAEHPQFTIRGVDYKSDDDLADALADHTAVLSIVGHGGISDQLRLISAAEKAKVEYFLPSEFGADFDKPANKQAVALYAPKRVVRRALEASALKYTYIVTGCFADWFLMPMYKWDLVNHTVEIPGDGTITSSFTSRQDIARYTVAVLCRLGEFDNQTVRIASHTLSFNDWVGLVEKVSDRKFTVTYVPPEPIEEMIAEDVKKTGGWVTLRDRLRLLIANGHTRSDWGEFVLDNSRFPEVEPVPIEQVISQALSAAAAK
ncbi:hypothetical protein EC988_003822 [Linderina pennispora]|nr:hypothetical protein EC988_003822 [Linderina pennispora]